MQQFGHNTWAKIGGSVPPLFFFRVGECRVGRGLYLRSKRRLNPSSCLATQQTWADNWGLCPFWGWGTGSPSNTMWPGPRPTSLPSFILISETVWSQYTTLQTDRQDRQTDNGSTNRFTNSLPKTKISPTLMGVSWSNGVILLG